jgi:hypothetical protein
LRRRERQGNRGWKSWVQNQQRIGCRTKSSSLGIRTKAGQSLCRRLVCFDECEQVGIDLIRICCRHRRDRQPFSR